MSDFEKAKADAAKAAEDLKKSQDSIENSIDLKRMVDEER